MLYNSNPKSGIGMWCNGNTDDSGSSVPGSNPGIPANFDDQANPERSVQWPNALSVICRVFFIFFGVSGASIAGRLHDRLSAVG